jgi:hypothetical protein
MRGCRIQLTRSPVGFRDVVMEVGDAIVSRERAREEVDRLLVSLALQREDAEQVERVEMIGTSGENLPIQALGFRKLTALMQRQRLRKSLLNVSRHGVNPYSNRPTG